MLSVATPAIRPHAAAVGMAGLAAANGPDIPLAPAGRPVDGVDVHRRAARAAADESLADMLADELAAAFAPPLEAATPAGFSAEDNPDLPAPWFIPEQEAAGAPGLSSGDAPPRAAAALYLSVALLAGLAGGGLVFAANALLTGEPPTTTATRPAADLQMPPTRHAAPPPVRPAIATSAAVAPPSAPAVAATVETGAEQAESGETTITASIPPVSLPHAPEVPAQETGRTILVEEGDSLSDIAERAYGDPLAYRRIFEANRDVLGRPESLKVGLQLRIP